MKKSILRALKFTAITAISALICICAACADNSINERSPNNNGEVDRFLGVPTITPGQVTTFTDSRDNKTYKKVTIGTQTWMAENLNYDVPSNTMGVCYGNSAGNCEKYGRLYNWATAKTACPVGWHLPSDAEWTTLTNYVGSTAGTKLKSQTGWEYYSAGTIGTDAYAFSALPGGYGSDYNIFGDYNFGSAGNNGIWWSATEYEYGTYDAWNRYMYYDVEYVSRYTGSKTYLYSVRCVAD